MADTVSSESPFVSGPGRTPNLFLIVSIVVFVMAVGSAVYFGDLGKFLPFLSTKPAPTPNLSLEDEFAQGFERARKLFDENQGLISDRSIMITYSGRLEDWDGSKSFTIVNTNTGKKATIIHEGVPPIEYYRRVGKNVAVKSDQESIKVGNEVLIATHIVPKTGAVRISRVTVVVP